MTRFIWYGGAREINNDGSRRPQGPAHNAAFEFAARNVRADYSDFATRGVMKKITCASDIVAMLNARPRNSIRSLDILSHGTEVSLNFSIRDDENCGFVTSFAARAAISSYGSFTDDVNAFIGGWRYFSDIDFRNFVEAARVQFHGCSATGEVPLLDNMAKTVSGHLHDAGKERAFVIGHVTKSTPEFPGRPHTNENQDYRHGLRAVYNGGEKAFETRKSGLLTDQEILARIGR